MTVNPSPRTQQQLGSASSSQFAVPAFSPNQLFTNASMFSHTGMPSNLAQLSPGMITGGMGKEESPQSAGDSFGDFDFGYAEELMSKAGITMGEDQQLPL
jgi:hypothetical protein